MAALVKHFGGKNSSGARLLEAGILADLFSESTEQTVRNTLKINPKILAAKWKEYNHNGVMEALFDESKVEKLGTIELFSKMWERSIDPGVSIQAANTIGGVMHPSSFVSSTHKLTMNEILSWVLLSPKTRKYLIGNGAKPVRGANLKLFAIAMEDMLKNIDASDVKGLVSEEE